MQEIKTNKKSNLCFIFVIVHVLLLFHILHDAYECIRKKNVNKNLLSKNYFVGVSNVNKYGSVVFEISFFSFGNDVFSCESDLVTF